MSLHVNYKVIHQVEFGLGISVMCVRLDKILQCGNIPSNLCSYDLMTVCEVCSYGTVIRILWTACVLVLLCFLVITYNRVFYPWGEYYLTAFNFYMAWLQWEIRIDIWIPFSYHTVSHWPIWWDGAFFKNVFQQ